jgi:hypothetical protein
VGGEATQGAPREGGGREANGLGICKARAPKGAPGPVARAYVHLRIMRT